MSDNFITPTTIQQDTKYLYAKVGNNVFNIRTFSNLRDVGNLTQPEIWDQLEPVNFFIDTNFNVDERKKLIGIFDVAKSALSYINTTDAMIKAIELINTTIYDTFTEIDFIERVSNYVITDDKITIPNLANKGERPRDTEAMTFYREHYDSINKIVVMNKVLFPIFGEIIYKVSVIDELSNKLKEMFAAGILNKVLAVHFSEIISKLQNYIAVIVSKTLPNDELLSFQGFTKDNMADDKLVKMLVKNFINIRLYREKGNIMTSISVAVRKSTTSDTNANRSVVYMPRNAPDQMSDEDSNTSTMEHEGHMFSETIDISTLVQFGVTRYIDDIVSSTPRIKEVFDPTYTFYTRSPFPPSPVNELILAIFINSIIGNAYGVKHINDQSFIKLVTLIQIYMVDHDFHQLVPLMSMKYLGEAKIVPDTIDNSIKIKEGIGVYYRNVVENLAHLDKFIDREKVFSDLSIYIVDQYHHYNVPDTLAINKDLYCTEDNTVAYGPDVISDIYRFIYHVKQNPTIHWGK
jgi:hypothetical protein